MGEPGSAGIGLDDTPAKRRVGSNEYGPTWLEVCYDCVCLRYSDSSPYSTSTYERRNKSLQVCHCTMKNT